MRSKYVIGAWLGAAMMLPAANGQAPGDQGITRQQADAILNELRQIRQMLQGALRAAQAPQQEQPVKAQMTLDGSYSLGSKAAPYTIVEFTDYQCPFCRRFHLETWPRIKKELVDTGKVRFVTRDFPLDFHPNAMRAAESARCAGEQNKFWEMRDTLGSNANKLSIEDIKGYAQGLGLDIPKFQACVDSAKYKPAVQKDLAEAAKLGVGGTPSFVVGKTTPDGVDGEVVVGALPFASFESKLREMGMTP